MRLFQRSTIAVAPAVALALAIAACGTTPTALTRTITVIQPTSTDDTPDKRPSPAFSAAHTPTLSKFSRCDANITVKEQTTTCAFAQNVFYAYWQSDSSPFIQAYSPTTGTSYRVTCVRATSRVGCSTRDGARVRFSTASVDRYTAAQASAYADSHDVGATSTSAASTPHAPAPAQPPPPPQPPASSDDFCATHDCIPNYDNGNGTTVQCSDGSYSHSGGIRGACSHHGGVG